MFRTLWKISQKFDNLRGPLIGDVDQMVDFAMNCLPFQNLILISQVCVRVCGMYGAYDCLGLVNSEIAEQN